MLKLIKILFSFSPLANHPLLTYSHIVDKVLNITWTLKITLEQFNLDGTFFYYVAKVVLMASLYSLINAIVLAFHSSLFVFINIHHENELSINSSSLFYSLLHYFLSSHIIAFKALLFRLHIHSTPLFRCHMREIFIPSSFMMALVTHIYQDHTRFVSLFSISLPFLFLSTSLTYFNYLITHMVD